MTTRQISRVIITVLLLIFPLFTFAQSFSARAEHLKLALGESFNLHLELEGLTTENSPDLSALKRDFQIVGQQQSSVLKIINGKSTSSMTWDLALVPMHEGVEEIPAISIQSNGEEFKTDNISIEVKSGSVIGEPQGLKSFKLAVLERVSNATPYKYERILLTYEMPIVRSLRNANIENFEIKDAIVDRQGDPKVQTRIIKGRSQQVLTMSYLITPLKEGGLSIPPLVIHAETAMPDSDRRANLNSSQDVFGDDDGDPFAQMHKLMQSFMQEDKAFAGLSSMRPITVSSRPIQLKVLAPVPGVTPWLPASNLKLTETWSGDAKVGEPMSRSIVFQASGLAPSQLPGLENQLASDQDMKVYADQPAFSENILQGSASSFRKDTFTIIPQRSGELRFRAIQVTWWDTVHHVKKISTLPEKIVHVLPGVLTLTSAPPKLGIQTANQIIPALSSSHNIVNFKSKPWVFFSIFLVFCFLTSLFFLIFSLQKKRGVPQVLSSREPSSAESKEDLNKCANVREIRQFLQSYSHSRWGTEVQATLPRIFSVAGAKLANFNKLKAEKILELLETALYAQNSADPVKLRHEIEEIFFGKGKKLNKAEISEGLLELNPS